MGWSLLSQIREYTAALFMASICSVGWFPSFASEVCFMEIKDLWTSFLNHLACVCLLAVIWGYFHLRLTFRMQGACYFPWVCWLSWLVISICFLPSLWVLGIAWLSPLDMIDSCMEWHDGLALTLLHSLFFLMQCIFSVFSEMKYSLVILCESYSFK